MQMAAVKESDKNSHNLQKTVAMLLLWLDCTHSTISLFFREMVRNEHLPLRTAILRR